MIGNVREGKVVRRLGRHGQQAVGRAHATQAGVSVAIAGGKTPGIIGQILTGRFKGTFFPAACAHRISGRGRWLAFGRKPQGRVIVDDGAREALVRRGKSLLPAGIRAVEGAFDAGDLVEIAGPDGASFARGLASYNAATLDRIKGKKTVQIREILGEVEYEEAVHRDNMVVMPN